MHFVYDYFRSISLVAMSWVWSLPLIILLTLQLSRIEGNSPTPSPHPPSYQPTPLHYPTAETSPSYRAVSTLQPYPSPRPTYRPAFSPTAAAPTQYPTLYTSHQTHRPHQEDTSPGYSRPARPLPPACTALRHYVVMLQNAVEESVCRNHYDKKIIRKHGDRSEDKCLAATVSAIRRCTQTNPFNKDCLAYFFRILDKEWSKLDSEYKYSSRRKDECFACDSLLDIYRTEVAAQAVLCGTKDVILTVDGKQLSPQWFSWLRRPDNKDEQFFNGVTNVLDRTLNIFSNREKDNYNSDKKEQVDGVLHDTLEVVEDHLVYMGQKVSDFQDNLKDFVYGAQDVIKSHVWDDDNVGKYKYEDYRENNHDIKNGDKHGNPEKSWFNPWY